MVRGVRCECGHRQPGGHSGWCKGHGCKECQCGLRGVKAGVEGTNGATHGVSMGINGQGVQ